MKQYDFFLGIDPDVTASGFALLDKQQRAFEFVDALTFPDAIKFLDALAAQERAPQVCIVIEDSDISTNWHYNPRDTKAVCAAKGRSVGLCHATARHLYEYAQSVGLHIENVRPLRKCWAGRDGKLTQAEAEYFMRGLPKRCNQECRDSALLAWVVAGLPVRVKPISTR